MNQWARWCVTFAGTALALLSIFFMFTLIIDPYNISLLGTFKKLNVYKPATLYQSRLIKAVGITRYKPDTIIIGSSVVDNGFTLPGATGEYESWRSISESMYRVIPLVYNAGVRDGNVNDMFAMLKHAYVNNPNLKRAIVGIEWSQVTGSETHAYKPGIPLLGHTMLFPLAYQKYLTWTAFGDAVQTVQDNVSFTRPGGIPGSSLLEALHQLLLTKSIASSNNRDVTPIPPGLYAKSPALIKSDLETRIFHFSFWFGRTFSLLKTESPENLHRAEALDVIHQMIAFANDHHIELIFYASPQPPLFWSVIRKSGTWPQYADWLRKFAELTPYYDLSALPEISEQAEAYFDGDPLHFSPAFGNKILSALLEDKRSPGMGYVTRDIVEADIALRSQQLDSWLAAHGYENEIINQLDFTPNKTDKLPEILPMSYEPSVNGFTIMRLLETHYFAVPVATEPYDFLRVLKHEYTGEIESGSLESVLKEIKRK